MLLFKAPGVDNTGRKMTQDLIEIQRCTSTARLVTDGASMHTESECAKCWVMCAESPAIQSKMEKLLLSACANQTSKLNQCCTLHCRQIYILAILWWWEDLIWRVTLAPFFPFIFLRTNQSCFCGDYWVCLSFTATAATRGICRATNQQDNIIYDFPSSFSVFHQQETAPRRAKMCTKLQD